jgi:NCS1 family nucleobase:cation symporter-1
VIAGHVAYVIAAADYPRYLPSDTPAKDIVRTVLWSAGGSGLLLGVVGILLASQTDADLVVDTFGGVRSLMPSWLYVPFLLAAIGGSLTNLMLTMYSAGLAAQAAGLPIKRYHAVIVDAVLSTIGLVYVLFYDEALLTTINDIVVNTIIWIGPWGVIWIYDAWRRNWNIDPVAAHGGPESPYWGSGGIYWPGAIALIAGMVAAWATISVPRYAGPISEHLLNYTDLSWLVGPLVALAVFIPLDRGQRPTVR